MFIGYQRVPEKKESSEKRGNNGRPLSKPTVWQRILGNENVGSKVILQEFKYLSFSSCKTWGSDFNFSMPQ